MPKALQDEVRISSELAHVAEPMRGLTTLFRDLERDHNVTFHPDPLWPAKRDKPPGVVGRVVRRFRSAYLETSLPLDKAQATSLKKAVETGLARAPLKKELDEHGIRLHIFRVPTGNGEYNVHIKGLPPLVPHFIDRTLEEAAKKRGDIRI